MSLIEGIAGIGILTLAALGALVAMLAGTHAVAAPANRDLALSAARNAAVEIRAVSAFDPTAAATVLAAPPASWQQNGVALQSSSDGTGIAISATSGAATASVHVTPSREALPQGAVIDTAGDVLSP